MRLGSGLDMLRQVDHLAHACRINQVQCSFSQLQAIFTKLLKGTRLSRKQSTLLLQYSNLLSSQTRWQSPIVPAFTVFKETTLAASSYFTFKARCLESTSACFLFFGQPDQNESNPVRWNYYNLHNRLMCTTHAKMECKALCFWRR